MERQRIAEASKGMGKPKVGGPFELLDQDGKPWNSKREMGGKFSLVCNSHKHTSGFGSYLVRARIICKS